MTNNEPKRPYYQPRQRADESRAEPQPPADQPTSGQQPIPGSQPTVGSQRTVQAPQPTQAAGTPPTRSGSAPARTSSTPSSSGWGQAGYQAPQPPPPANPPPAQRAAPQKKAPRRKVTSYNVLKVLFFVGLIGVALLVCGVATGVVGYVSIASSLPSPDELEQRATQMFTSSQIYDRNGNLLYELLDTEGGRRTFVPLDKISPWVTARHHRHGRPALLPASRLRRVWHCARHRAERARRRRRLGRQHHRAAAGAEPHAAGRPRAIAERARCVKRC